MGISSTLIVLGLKVPTSCSVYANDQKQCYMHRDEGCEFTWAPTLANVFAGTCTLTQSWWDGQQDTLLSYGACFGCIYVMWSQHHEISRSIDSARRSRGRSGGSSSSSSSSSSSGSGSPCNYERLELVLHIAFCIGVSLLPLSFDLLNSYWTDGSLQPFCLPEGATIAPSTRNTMVHLYGLAGLAPCPGDPDCFCADAGAGAAACFVLSLTLLLSSASLLMLDMLAVWVGVETTGREKTTGPPPACSSSSSSSSRMLEYAMLPCGAAVNMALIAMGGGNQVAFYPAFVGAVAAVIVHVSQSSKTSRGDM